MDTSKLNLFVFDSKENFEKSKSQLGVEGSTLKRIFQIDDVKQFTHIIENELKDEDLIFLVIHVFAKEEIKGITKFKVSGIPDKYPSLNYMYISDGASESDIQKLMVDKRIITTQVYRYWQVISELKESRIKAISKRNLIINGDQSAGGNEVIPNLNFPTIKYAIITALYKDEFEELKKIFDFPQELNINTPKKIFYRGFLKTNKEIEVVAAVPNSTGMLDSAIVASLLLEYFRPEYLLMSGVCGASNDYSFGDIVVAKQVFTFQKGKISDIKRMNEDGSFQNIDLYDINGNLVDYKLLFDNDGNQVAISIEKFEVEQDAIIQLDSFFEDSLNPKLETIKQKINFSIRNESYLNIDRDIKIVLEPMACSTMVINKNGYFNDTIKSIHRKTAAVEMESYGVARACQFANGGKTKALIFKSVMDNTVNKSDFIGNVNWKKFAAFTSAQFMKQLFEENVI